MTNDDIDRCINHPDKSVRANLDGDDLCQECCDNWVKSEKPQNNYSLEELKANVRTHVPDFEMASEIMRRIK